MKVKFFFHFRSIIKVYQFQYVDWKLWHRILKAFFAFLHTIEIFYLIYIFLFLHSHITIHIFRATNFFESIAYFHDLNAHIFQIILLNLAIFLFFEHECLLLSSSYHLFWLEVLANTIDFYLINFLILRFCLSLILIH